MNTLLKTIGSLGIVGYAAIIIYFIAIIPSWPVNIYQLTQCDFEAPYKCEVIHSAGLIPLASPVTVWVDTGK